MAGGGGGCVAPIGCSDGWQGGRERERERERVEGVLMHSLLHHTKPAYRL